MKNLFYLITLVLLPSSLFAKSDEPFQGKISYNITYEGEGADFLRMVSFSGYDYYFGDNQNRVSVAGGMAYLMGDFITDKAGKTIMIDDTEKIAYTMDDYADDGKEGEKLDEILVVKTKKKEKILGYKCYQYLVTVKTDSSESTSEYWTTTKITVDRHEELGITNTVFIDGMEGFPLKIVSRFEGITMTQIANEVSEFQPEAALFEIPSTYQVKDIEESPLMKMVNEEEE